MSAQKVSLYSLSELKSTCDDHVPIYLSSPNTPSEKPLSKELRFTASYKSTYIRLGLGYSAVLIALYNFFLDYIQHRDFKETKTVAFWSVIGYFVLNSALTLWLWFGERGVIFSGTRVEAKGKSKGSGSTTATTTTSLHIYSHSPSKKYSPVYRLSASWTVSDSHDKSGTVEITVPFTRFFTEDSHFAPAEFEAWLRREIPIVGQKASATGRVESIQPQDADLVPEGKVQNEDGHIAVEGSTQVLQSQRGDTIVLNSAREGSEAVMASPSAKKRGRPRKDQ